MVGVGHSEGQLVKKKTASNNTLLAKWEKYEVLVISLVSRLALCVRKTALTWKPQTWRLSNYDFVRELKLRQLFFPFLSQKIDTRTRNCVLAGMIFTFGKNKILFFEKIVQSQMFFKERSKATTSSIETQQI